jgi:hypothetical protein
LDDSVFFCLFIFLNQPRRKWRFWLVGCGDGVRVYRDSQSAIFQKPTPFFDPHPFCYEKRGGIYWPLLNLFFGVCVIYFLDVGSLFIEFLFSLLIQPIGTTPLSELLRRKGAGPCRSRVFYFFEILVTPNENEKTRMYTKPWYHVLMNAKKIIQNEIEMKPKLTKSKRNCFPKNIRNVGERISGG